MIVINYAHPITSEQRGQIEALAGLPVSEIREVTVHFDPNLSFAAQLSILLEDIPLSAVEWQTEQILINPPSHNSIALLLIAYLHGRMGHFPAVLRLKPRPGAVPGYDAAEIINLQAVRDAARRG